MPRPPRPGHDEPEELPEFGSGADVRVFGGGEAETLAEPPVRMIPMGRWVGPVFLLTVLTALVGVLVVTLLPWIRPVHLATERAHQLFAPPLTVDGRSWSEPGDLEPDIFMQRFCSGLLLRAVDPADNALMSTGRGRQPGNAVTAVFAERVGADEAYSTLSDGLANCTQRGARWVAVESGAVEEAAHRSVAFRLQPSRQVRGNRQHLLLVQSANTITLFMTPTAPDAEATTAAYRERVAAVARARE